MRIAGYIQDSIVDGPGLRFVLFAQGCCHGCKGCQNPETHDIAGGHEESAWDIISAMLGNPLTDGLTLSGGEPFLQTEDCIAIAAAAKDAGLNVWCYTGYELEQLMDDCKHRRLLDYIDVLVDGRFILERRTLNLPWRGSANQRLLNVSKSLETGAAVLYD